jgi:NADH-quinone oxidoreductase subunit C
VAEPEQQPPATEAPAPEPAVARYIREFGDLPAVNAVGLEQDEIVLHAERDGLVGLMRALRDAFGFEQVMDICGVDFPDREERFDVVYNLLSVSKNRRLRVIVTTDEEKPVPSVWTIWPCATWWEREAWDLFGVVFSGQPDLRRILTDYGFEGHPLRKDFPLTGHVEVRYDEERKQVIYEPVKLTQDWRSFDFISPWEGVTTLPGDEKVHQERMHPTRTPPVPLPRKEGQGA